MNIIKALETTLVSLCLPALIFTAAILAFLQAGEKFLAILLFVSGVLAVFKDVREKWGNK